MNIIGPGMFALLRLGGPLIEKDFFPGFSDQHSFLGDLVIQLGLGGEQRGQANQYAKAKESFHHLEVTALSQLSLVSDRS